MKITVMLEVEGQETKGREIEINGQHIPSKINEAVCQMMEQTNPNQTYSAAMLGMNRGSYRKYIGKTNKKPAKLG